MTIRKASATANHQSIILRNQLRDEIKSLTGFTPNLNASVDQMIRTLHKYGKGCMIVTYAIAKGDRDE